MRRTLPVLSAPILAGPEPPMISKMWRRRVRKATWGIGDQALSSLTNAGVNIYLARQFGSSALGAFTIGFSAYLLALAAGRALSSEIFAVFSEGIADKRDDRRRDEAGVTQGGDLVAGSAGYSLGLGIGLAAPLIVAGVLLGGRGGYSLIIVGLAMPGLLLQELWRHVFFAWGSGDRAFLNDFVWALVLVLLLVTASWAGADSYRFTVAAWGASGALAGALGIAQSRVWPGVKHAYYFVRRTRRYSLPVLGEALITSGTQQLTNYGIGLMAGFGALGTVRAGQSVLGPIRMLTQGFRLVGLPAAARREARNAGGSLRIAWTGCLILGAVPVVVSTGLLLLPEAVGELLLKDTWNDVRELVVPLGLAMGGLGVMKGANIGLRSVAATGAEFRVGVTSGVAHLVLATMGAILGGAAGAAGGLALGGIVRAGIAGVTLHHVTRRVMAEEGRST